MRYFSSHSVGTSSRAEINIILADASHFKQLCTLNNHIPNRTKHVQCRLNDIVLFFSREVFGMDILVDSDYKPWILEMNISPSMQAATEEDVVVKAPLIADLMNMWRLEFVAEDDADAVSLSFRSKPLAEHKSKLHLLKEAQMLDFYHSTGVSAGGDLGVGLIDKQFRLELDMFFFP